MNKKALFLDRDGILIEDTAYPHKREDLVLKKSIFPLLKEAKKRGYLLIVVTNQSGIARGYFSEEEFHQFQGWMFEAFKEEGIEFDGSFFCPFLKDGKIKKYRKDSQDRKPNPGMFLKAKKKLGIDIEKSLMIGDKTSDRIPLEGLRCFLIRGNYPITEGNDIYENEEQLLEELGWK